jgi:hypothetical protein
MVLRQPGNRGWHARPYISGLRDGPRDAAPLGSGGNDDSDGMLAFLRSTGRIRESKIDRLERAYRIERDRLSCRASRRKFRSTISLPAPKHGI